MKKLVLTILVLFFSMDLFGQSILSSGSIYEGEFTPDKKISGLFTYMNNSDQNLVLEVERKSENGNEMVINRDVAPRRGRQLRVYEQEYSVTEEQVYGDYSISFYLVENGVKKNLVFQYTNLSEEAPFLRVVSVVFSGISEDEYGRYIEVRIDWQAMRSETQTDNKKCYLYN
jgi:hypothetical protein